MTILTSLGKPLAQTDSTFSKDSCLHLADKAKPGSKQQARWKQRALDAELSDGTRLADFLGHLHRGGTFKYLWRPSISRWYEYETKRPAAQDGKDTYFGIHPSQFIPQTNAKGKKKPPAEVRSQLTSISAINCLFAEIDARDFITNSDEEITGRADLFRSEHPNWTETRANQEAEKALTQGKLDHRLTEFKKRAWQHVQSMSPPPSVVIDSGGGYHCYWFLDEPFYTVTQANRELAQRLQSDWVCLMGGDPGAKDLARVLRLPGTSNTKYTPAQPVRFVHWDIERTYHIDALTDRAKDVAKGAEKQAPATPAIPLGKPTYTTTATDEKEEKQRALDSLAPGRCDDYNTWLKVGFACHHDRDMDRTDWDRWSGQSSKFADPGNDKLMSEKWETFTAGKGITFKTIFKWAHQDTPGWHRVAPEQPQTAEVTEVLQAVFSPPDELPSRLTICGQILSFSNPNALDGLIRRCLVCGDFRNCECCALAKGAGLRDRVIESMQAGTVYVARTDKRDGTRIVRRLGKANVMRIPLGDDLVVIFNTDKNDKVRGEGVELLETNIPSVSDFAEFVRCAAVGKRITGGLGQDADKTVDVSEKPDKTETDTVLINMIAHDCDDREREKQIYKAAWERTKAKVLARPLTTATDIEFAHDCIMTEFKKLLRMSGYEVTYQVHKHVTCDLVRIALWKDTYALNHGYITQGQEDAKTTTRDTHRAG